MEPHALRKRSGRQSELSIRICIVSWIISLGVWALAGPTAASMVFATAIVTCGCLNLRATLDLVRAGKLEKQSA